MIWASWNYIPKFRCFCCFIYVFDDHWRWTLENENLRCSSHSLQFCVRSSRISSSSYFLWNLGYFFCLSPSWPPKCECQWSLQFVCCHYSSIIGWVSLDLYESWIRMNLVYNLKGSPHLDFLPGPEIDQWSHHSHCTMFPSLLCVNTQYLVPFSDFSSH